MILILLIDVRLHKYPCALYYLLCVFSILHWMRHSAVKAIILQNKVTVDSYPSINYRRTDLSTRTLDCLFCIIIHRVRL